MRELSSKELPRLAEATPPVYEWEPQAPSSRLCSRQASRQASRQGPGRLASREALGREATRLGSAGPQPLQVVQPLAGPLPLSLTQPVPVEDLESMLPPTTPGKRWRPPSATRTLRGGWRSAGGAGCSEGVLGAVPPEVPTTPFAAQVYHRKWPQGGQAPPPGTKQQHNGADPDHSDMRHCLLSDFGCDGLLGGSWPPQFPWEPAAGSWSADIPATPRVRASGTSSSPGTAGRPLRTQRQLSAGGGSRPPTGPQTIVIGGLHLRLGGVQRSPNRTRDRACVFEPVETTCDSVPSKSSTSGAPAKDYTAAGRNLQGKVEPLIAGMYDRDQGQDIRDHFAAATQEQHFQRPTTSTLVSKRSKQKTSPRRVGQKAHQAEDLATARGSHGHSERPGTAALGAEPLRHATAPSSPRGAAPAPLSERLHHSGSGASEAEAPHSASAGCSHGLVPANSPPSPASAQRHRPAPARSASMPKSPQRAEMALLASPEAKHAEGAGIHENEAIWVDVFAKLRHDGELHRDEIPRALELCGLARPDRAWADEIFSGLTKYNTLSEHEFVHLVHKYIERQRQAHTEAFHRCDNDGSGMVDRAELGGLLKSFGIAPMKHVLDEVLDEVDEDGQGLLDINEFQHVMDLLLRREGFTKKEYHKFMEVYHMFDRDHSGHIDTKELVSLLNWLGYACDKARAAQITKEVDVDASGFIDEREFLICMRKLREREVQILIDAIAESDEDGNGTISGGREIEAVFRALGYHIVDEVAIEDAVRETGVDPEKGELDLSSLWRLLGVYRAREGLSVVDTNDITKAFERYDKDKRGHVSTLEVGKMLRWLGYPVSFEVQQAFITRVDIDESGRLDVGEFRKMMRMLRERDVAMVHEAWQRVAGDSATITKVEALSAIDTLGVIDRHSCPEEAFLPEDFIRGADPKGPCLDLKGFIRASLRLSQTSRAVFRQNGGFSASEVDQLQVCFKRYDADGSGDISNKELVHLIEEIFPVMASDKAMRPELLQILKEVDADGNGCLDFPDFLRLMKQFQELQDRERVQKELTAIRETGFDATEVAEFRELFLAADDGTGELSLQEITRMICMIVPLGDQLKSELTDMFRQVTGRQMHVEGSRNEADFPEFLWLMKKLLQKNFANINERTKMLHKPVN